MNGLQFDPNGTSDPARPPACVTSGEPSPLSGESFGQSARNAIDRAALFRRDLPLYSGNGAVELYVLPGTSMTWSEFVRTFDSGIALDGAVRGRPRFVRDGDSVHVNLDHHQGVERWATRSALGQAYSLMKLRAFNQFQVDGRVVLPVVVNDPDPDGSSTVFAFREFERVCSSHDPLFAELVSEQCFADSHKGIFSRPLTDRLVQQMAWIFDPYNRRRFELQVCFSEPSLTADIIEECCDRLRAYCAGRADILRPETGYEVIDTGREWLMAVQRGAFAPNAILAEHGDAVNACALVEPLADGRTRATFRRFSCASYFPLTSLCEVLNHVERLVDPRGVGRWGGGDDIIGSPRPNGTAIPVPMLSHLTHAFVDFVGSSRPTRGLTRRFIEERVSSLIAPS